MELASVNIFQLGDPESCISTLDDFVGDSLDSKKIKLLALMELREFSKCLILISEMLSEAKDDNELSIIYYHKGVAESQSGNYKDGFVSFCGHMSIKTTLQHLFIWYAMLFRWKIEMKLKPCFL